MSEPRWVDGHGFDLPPVAPDTGPFPNREFLWAWWQHMAADDEDVLVAEDGVEALAVCAQAEDPVLLAVLDVTMPRMNGPDTLRALRQRYPSIQAVFVTGHDSRGALEGDQLFSACESLQKPYRAAQLTQAVARALGDGA